MDIRRVFLPAAAAALVACGGEKSPAIDEALRQDLSLAGQAFAPQQFVSPLEAGYAPNGYAPNGYAPMPYPQAYGVQPAVARAPSRTVRRTSGSAGGGGTRVVKNTKRDAAIGAVAGAAIGAVTTSRRDRMKGAVLGAAVGAVLGGVIGNNVDLTKVPRQ